MPAESDLVDGPDLPRAPLNQHVGRYVQADSSHSTYKSRFTDSGVVMHRGQATKGRVAFNNNVPTEKHIVSHRDPITEYAIVRDMTAGHQEVLISNDRVASSVAGPEVDGYAFTNGISVTYKDPGVLALEFFVLGSAPITAPG